MSMDGITGDGLGSVRMKDVEDAPLSEIMQQLGKIERAAAELSQALDVHEKRIGHVLSDEPFDEGSVPMDPEPTLTTPMSRMLYGRGQDVQALARRLRRLDDRVRL